MLQLNGRHTWQIRSTGNDFASLDRVPKVKTLDELLQDDETVRVSALLANPSFRFFLVGGRTKLSRCRFRIFVPAHPPGPNNFAIRQRNKDGSRGGQVFDSDGY
jgi:hypothetical protein